MKMKKIVQYPKNTKRIIENYIFFCFCMYTCTFSTDSVNASITHPLP